MVGPQCRFLNCQRALVDGFSLGKLALETKDLSQIGESLCQIKIVRRWPPVAEGEGFQEERFHPSVPAVREIEGAQLLLSLGNARVVSSELLGFDQGCLVDRFGLSIAGLLLE